MSKMEKLKKSQRKIRKRPFISSHTVFPLSGHLAQFTQPQMLPQDKRQGYYPSTLPLELLNQLMKHLQSFHLQILLCPVHQHTIRQQFFLGNGSRFWRQFLGKARASVPGIQTLSEEYAFFLLQINHYTKNMLKNLLIYVCSWQLLHFSNSTVQIRGS